MSDTEITACVIVIGNEILSGRTPDANVNYLACGLEEVGVRLREVRIIPDVHDTIVATVNECRGKFDHVFTTGGIGPTHDDITAEAVAAAFGVKLVRDPRAVELLKKNYKDPARELNDMRLRMANIPEGAALIDNPISFAPGFRLGNVNVLPGVPRIMQVMFDGVKAQLKGGAPLVSRTVVLYLPEGLFAQALGDVQLRLPAVEIGSYPFLRHGRLGAAIVLKGCDPVQVDEAVEAVRQLGLDLGATPELE